ncbi:pyridoxamine 5'-phosphate oxidase family protein [Dyadobacter sp. OTU695]|uniref:pyridoxamine 5'-phosphate oxidase family protein n=1 Tax=Dyadobacter sp. OTU695 TaxID=3043860 RepID=UPI00313B8B58
MNYSQLAFTDEIKAIQERMGSRNAYERHEKQSYVEGLTEVEESFIGQMDSIFMASYGENGFPYIQHRGGPKGFLKVIDNRTIGFVDFSGNRQYISVGNLAHNPKVSLILLSYPLRARLKIYAEAEVVEINSNTGLFEQLKPDNYRFKPERMILLHIKAYDWNCPQHINPKYNVEEIEQLFMKDQYVEQLEKEIEVLRSRISQLTT